MMLAADDVVSTPVGIGVVLKVADGRARVQHDTPSGGKTSWVSAREVSKVTPDALGLMPENTDSVKPTSVTVATGPKPVQRIKLALFEMMGPHEGTGPAPRQIGDVQVAADASSAELIMALSGLVTAPFDPTQIISPPPGTSLDTNFHRSKCKMCTSPNDAVALAQPVSEFISGAYIGKRHVVQPTVHIVIERDSALPPPHPSMPLGNQLVGKGQTTDKEEVEDLRSNLGIGSSPRETDETAAAATLVEETKAKVAALREKKAGMQGKAYALDRSAVNREIRLLEEEDTYLDARKLVEPDRVAADAEEKAKKAAEDKAKKEAKAKAKEEANAKKAAEAQAVAEQSASASAGISVWTVDMRGMGCEYKHQCAACGHTWAGMGMDIPKSMTCSGCGKTLPVTDKGWGTGPPVK